MNKRDLITAERVRELFSYDANTGLLTRLMRTPNTKVGDVAGSRDSRGYMRVSINDVLYLVHRVVWLHYYGVQPLQMIDHKDRNPSNNKIENLQDVSRNLNAQNVGSHKGVSSKFKGVSWHAQCSKWQVKINHGGKDKYLGIYSCEKQAAAAYLAAANIYHSNSNPANLSPSLLSAF